MRSRSRWLQVQSDLGEAMIIIEGGRFVSTNDAFERITGYSSDELRALPSALELVVADDRDQLLTWMRERAEGQPSSAYQEVSVQRRDGRIASLELAAKRDAGRREGPRVLIIARDITERKRAEAAVIRNEAVMRGTLEATADGILVVDTKRRVIHHNRRFADLWRIPEEVLDSGSSQTLLAHTRDMVADGEAFVARVESIYATNEELVDEVQMRDGRVLERFTRPLLGGGLVAGRVWSFRDVTERERVAEVNRAALTEIAEAKVRLEAKSSELVAALANEQERGRRDPLTGSLNHGAISSVLHDAVTTPNGEHHAVVMVDVDGLKAVNDTFGHLAGDRLLVTVARGLDCLDAIVGRYGGDEFAVCLRGVDRSAAEQYMANVKEALDAIETWDEDTGVRIPVAVSLGLAMFPDDASTVVDLVKLADGAMYTAKRSRATELMEGAQPLRRRDDIAVRLVAELIPLLTSQGALGEKLNLIGRRLADAARL